MNKDRKELHDWSVHSLVSKRILLVHFPWGCILCRGQEANRISRLLGTVILPMSGWIQTYLTVDE